MRKTTQAFHFFFFVFIFLFQPARSQDGAKTEAEPHPVATLVESIHDFGRVNETEGLATHVFQVKNTGTAPLIIKQVQSSCGCTKPQWTSRPIEPGQAGEVEITFDPRNRPGPFRKNIMIYTNDLERRLRVTIMGDVIPKPDNLQRALQDTIGPVLTEQKAFLFYAVRPGATLTQEMWIQNFSEEDVTLSVEDVPDYLTIETPGLLKSGQAERFKVTLNGAGFDKRGRLLSRFTWKTVSASGVTVSQVIPVTMNLVDDFTTQTAEEKANAPAIRFSSTVLKYGKLKKPGFLGLGNKRVSREIIITNTGKSELTLHNISCDHAHVRTEVSRKTLQPEETATLTVVLTPKNITGTFVTDVYIICNDPRGPVREIRVIAEK